MRSILAVSLLILSLAACGRTAAPSPDAQTSTLPTEPAVGESPLSPVSTPPPAPPERTSPLPDPSSSPIEPPSETTDDVISAAKEYLAEQLGITPESVDTVTIEPVAWPDASLGCPELGMAYAQVVTPGYRIVLEANGREHELHTDQSGEAIVMCEQGVEREARAAVEHLAEELEISPKDIKVLLVQDDEWRDTSLGCPEPGRSYAQVITPGYRVILEAQGETFEVHTDREGRIVVLCDSPR